MEKTNIWGVKKARFIVGYIDDYGCSREDHHLNSKREAQLRKKELRRLDFKRIYIKKRVR